jgi:hypothetical protein
MAIEREDLDWGVRLSVNPFTGKHAALMIRAEIDAYRPGKGAEVRVAFSGTSMADPLRLLDAQTWNEALAALIVETRKIVAELKEAAATTKTKKRR